MRRFALWGACITSLFWTTAGFSAEPDKSDASDTGAKQRMDTMRQRAEALVIVASNDERLKCSQEPLLRYNDVPRNIVDASLWALGKVGRPEAILVLEIYGGASVQYEFTSVADPPKSVGTGRWRWTPQGSDFSWKQIEDAPSPHEAKRTRLRQIKQLARDFSAEEEWRGQTYHLRLMPQPIYQYQDEARGVLDGAIFALAHGTNVEILMTIEARVDQDSSRHWQAGFSRLASATLDVVLRDQPFWTSPSGTTARATSAYYFRMEPLTPDERRVFAADD